MPYLWQGALSIVSQTLLLMGASMSPSLSAIISTLTPNADVVISDVVGEIERYAHLAPSISLSAQILSEAEMRRNSFLGGWNNGGMQQPQQQQHIRKSPKLDALG
jgi:hypothetical protein